MWCPLQAVIMETKIKYALVSFILQWSEILLIDTGELIGKSQLATTCSKLTIEKLEQGVKYVQS